MSKSSTIKIKRLYKLAKKPRSTSMTHESRDYRLAITSGGCRKTPKASLAHMAPSSTIL
jgi:hypothetical protein